VSNKDIWPERVCYQDPYRRLVFGRTKEELAKAVRDIDRL